MNMIVLYIERCLNSWRMLLLIFEIRMRYVFVAQCIRIFKNNRWLTFILICFLPQKKQRNLVWVSCEGESPADVENLGAVNYSPRRGFPAYYFPYKNQKGYQPPIVAVQFAKPKRKCFFSSASISNFLALIFDLTHHFTSSSFSFLFVKLAGVLINIECKAWAKNILYDRSERRGSVHFELMID